MQLRTTESEIDYTVICRKCGNLSQDYCKRGNQKYLQVRCKKCGYLLPSRRVGHEYDRPGRQAKEGS